MLAVMIRRAPPLRTGGQRMPAQPDPEGVRQQLLRSPDAQNDLRRRDPDLAAALNHPAHWRDAFALRQRQADDAERERQNQIALLNEDPFNVEAQRKIEDLIRQDRVVENLQKAYDENPEGACLSYRLRPFSPPYLPASRLISDPTTQSLCVFICSMFTPKSMAFLSRPLSTRAPKPPSCLPTAPNAAASCASWTCATRVWPAVSAPLAS